MKRFLALFLGLVLSAQPAWAAVVFDADTDSTGTGTSVSFSHTVAAGANLFLVACVQTQIATHTLSDVTYNSVAMTSHQRLTDTGAMNECFKLVAPATGANTFAATISASTGWTAIVASFSGVDQTTPADTAVTDIGVNNNSVSVNVSSAVGNIVFDAVNVTQDGGENGLLTIGADQTSHMSRELTDAACSSSREAGAATVTMSWTWTWNNQNLAEIAFDINAAADNKGPLFKRYYDLLRSSLLRKEGLSDLAFSEVR